MVIFQVKLLQDCPRRNFFTSQPKENNQTKNSLLIQKRLPYKREPRQKNYLISVTVNDQFKGTIVSTGFPSKTTCSTPSSVTTAVVKNDAFPIVTRVPTSLGNHSENHWCLLLKKRIIMLSQRISQNSSSDFILLCSLQKLIKSGPCKVKHHIFLRPRGNSLLRLWIYRNIRKADFSVGLNTMRRHTSSQKEHHCTQ